MQAAGMLEVLLQRLVKVADTTGKIVASTVLGSITTAFVTGSSFLSILIPGELFAPVYRRRNLAAKNLSRTTEDSGTVVVPLVKGSNATPPSTTVFGEKTCPGSIFTVTEPLAAPLVTNLPTLESRLDTVTVNGFTPARTA